VNNIRAIAFDLYGTLFDVHSVVGVCDAAYPGKGAALRWRSCAVLKGRASILLRTSTAHALNGPLDFS
jgi:FMN phosphatase YigB (HAD superfamily)